MLDADIAVLPKRLSLASLAEERRFDGSMLHCLNCLRGVGDGGSHGHGWLGFCQNAEAEAQIEASAEEMAGREVRRISTWHSGGSLPLDGGWRTGMFTQ